MIEYNGSTELVSFAFSTYGRTEKVGKIDELRMFVAERYPKIMEGKRFNLGILKNDHLWNIDQPDVIEVIVNCISYSLIRDEYREYIKRRSK